MERIYDLTIYNLRLQFLYSSRRASAGCIFIALRAGMPMPITIIRTMRIKVRNNGDNKTAGLQCGSVHPGVQFGMSQIPVYDNGRYGSYQKQ